MPHTNTAALDRRVAVIEGGADDQETIRRVSDLGAIPFLVFLGEPGIGKSTVLEQEAAREGVPVFKVRDLMTGAQTNRNDTLYLDGLDEYRTDGRSSDKVHSLAQSLVTANASRWRLACRSEDWRKGADMAPLRKAAAGAPVVVVHLLPLDHDEAVTVLAALGEGEPESFLTKAISLGATGFTENALSLKLLYTAVAGGGTWPRTRGELFATAVRRLTFERNEEHKWRGDRHAPHEILSAAARACLLLLTSGSRAIWRSNDEPPMGIDARANVSAHDIGLDPDLLDDMLDTPLFRGEGEAFEPMHRTIAEYLAGEALAKAVVGSGSLAALPLSRAVALITGGDGLPPTELRGLYAWFAAHLARLGDGAAAIRLIEIDAVTVLAYGDATVFDTAARRAILVHLDRNDPYFRASEVQATAVGGLGGEDLADDFRSVLTSPPDGSHRLLTVFDALANGPPVQSIRPVLRNILLDVKGSGWQRRRAFDAFLNGEDNPAEACRELFDALADEPVSIDREELRLQVVARMPPDLLTASDVVSILIDYQKCPEDHTVGRLSILRHRLEKQPFPDIFDAPIKNLYPAGPSSSHRLEVGRVLDCALSGAITHTPDLSAKRLWQWTRNVCGAFPSKLPDHAANALTAWLDAAQGRDLALFDAALAHDDLTKAPWVIVNNYIITTRRHPSAAVIRHLVARAQYILTTPEKRRLLEIAVDVARRRATDSDAFWTVYHAIANEQNSGPLLQHLTVAEIDSWTIEGQERVTNAIERDAKDRATNIQIMEPWLADMRVGGRSDHLAWAARLYLQTGCESGSQTIDLEMVMEFTDDNTMAAILAGWEHVATNGLGEIGIDDLAKAEAEGQTYSVEEAAIAGVDQLLGGDRKIVLEAAPISVAVAVLKSSFLVSNNDRRTRLERWALDRLNLDPTIGAAQLIDFWCATLDAGATRLTTLWRLFDDDASGGAVEYALEFLLSNRPDMPSDPLHAALRAGAIHLTPVRVLAIAVAALDNAAVTGKQRAIWSFVASALDPAIHAQRFLAEHSDNDVVELLTGDLSRGLLAAFAEAGRASQPRFNAMIVRLIGPKVVPKDDQPFGTVSGAINALARDPQPEVIAILSTLINDPNLVPWQPYLRHAQAQQALIRRDHGFKHPTPAAVREAIAGGPPVNARDLRAVVIEELLRLRDELHTTDTTPWKNYWNLHGEHADKPVVENQCRDRLLDRLRDRLKKYVIAAIVPEARRGEETRTDMLVLSQAGRNLPMEVKRHFHPDIWGAASTQLQNYTADPDADGFGIYLVFWFGNDINPTPARHDGSVGPRSASELESMLQRDLLPELRARTDVVVFDVSNPARAALNKPRQRRGSKRRGAPKAGAA